MTRDSRFEMIRINAMILIILHHIALYTDIVNSKVLYVQILGELIVMGGKIGCFLFILLTGYFAKRDLKSYLKMGIKCWVSAAFYGGTIASLLYISGKNVTAIDIVKGYLPILGGGVLVCHCLHRNAVFFSCYREDNRLP